MINVNFLYKHLKNSLKKDISSYLGLNLAKPLEISIQPNKRCNARCLMCDCWKERNDYLNYKEIIETLQQLKIWLGSNFFVQIAGGEPLIFKGIYDIFYFCSKNNIVCKINTNGIALTEKNCDKIIESGLAYLSVSLDSHLPEIHDKFRGVNNTFVRAVKGIEYLAKNGNLTLGISSILMKYNITTFSDSVEFFLKLPIHRLLIQPIRVWTENLPIAKWNTYQYWVNDVDVLNNFIKYLISKKKADNRILNSEKDILVWRDYFINPALSANTKKKKCKICYDRLTINYKGDIYLGCTNYSSIGNIKNDNLKKLWNSPKAKNIRQKMIRCRYPCTSNCYNNLTLKEKIVKAKVLLKTGLFSNKYKT